MKVKRIAIIGSPGTGKTTLAKILGTKTGLPIYHLDQYCNERLLS
jgi:adenylate kinase family enzyme